MQFEVIPEHEDHGWNEEDGNVSVAWMSGPPAPDAVLNLLARDCTRRCKRDSCSCISNGLKCTDRCRLKECDNFAESELVDEDSDNSDDDDFELAELEAEEFFDTDVYDGI